LGKSNGFGIASGRRGQDSSEYLVVLGAVLVIALIVVTLLASGINVSGPNRSESEAYWASTSPIKIVSSKMVSGTLILGLQNTGNLRIYLTGLSVSGTSLNLFHYYTDDNYGNSYCNSTSGGYVCDIYLQVGKVVYLAAKEAETCPENGLMEFKDVVMTYRTKGISDFKLVGERPLVVPCSGIGANMTLVTFYGYVNDGLGQPVANANVTVSRTGFTASVLTNSLGGYVLPDLAPTAFALQAGKDAYFNTSLSATLSPNVPVRQDFTIHSIPQFSFTPPTPDDGATVQDITINLSIQNSTIPLVNFNLDWNGQNYSILDPSLVLMYNFDDVAAIGDTASKAVDLSPGYQSNGTIYGNTQLLLHMDENSGSVAYDESVYRNNATCYNMNGGSGVTNCSWATGKSGTGIGFDGVDDYGAISTVGTLLGDLTLTAWVKPSPVQAYNARILDLTRPSNYGLELCITQANGQLFLNDGYGPSNTRYGPVINDGSWHFIAIVRKNTDYLLYADGIFQNATNGTVPTYTNLTMGRMYNNNYYYNGSIDEVIVANRSLSASEILAQYNSGRARHADWDPSGKYGGAMNFDGVNDYVNVTRDLLYPYNGTIELWAKTNDLTSQKMILWSGATGHDGWGGGPEVYFGVLSSKFYIGIADVRFVALGGYADTTSPANLDWNHLAISWNADGTINTYMNGVRINSVVRAVPTLNKASWEPDILIGRPSANTRYFNGSVDEVRVWNRTLSDSEVSQHYYGSLNKYAADKWLFQSTQEYVYSGTYSFQANLKPDQKWALFSQNRTNSFNTAIMFMPPTPANNSETYDILLNASLDNMTVRTFIFSANDTNATIFDPSLVLMYNFDDVAAIGDSARQATDASTYGNNGTIYGNTVLLLHMDENAGSFVNDSTVYRNNGTIYGAAWTAGKNGRALNFDGSDDYVNFGDPANGNLDMGTDNFTASFWFRGLIYDRPILSKKSTSGDVDAGLVVYLDSPGWHLRTRIANGTHAIAVSSIRDYLNDNAWHYGTIIKSGNQLFVYVDGTTDNNISVPSSFNINNSINFLLGKGNTGTWNGAIDEVAIHRRALTPSEVLSHYNAGVAKHAEWDPAGRWGSAIKLDGVNDYVNVSSPEGLNFTDQMTISAWTRADNLTLTGAYAPRILNKQGSFEIIVNVPQYNGHSRPEFRITQSGSANYFLANNNLTINGWTFVAFTYNGSKVTSFINGALDRNVSFSGNVDASASGLIIGARNTVQGFFNGTIDEVRIWNRSLSADEISQVYYSNLAKYAPSKWMFTYNYTDPRLGPGPYFAWVRTLGNNVLATDSRNISAINKIRFIAATPENATIAYDLNITATLSNISLRQAKLNLNGANYTAYDESLVLAFNFDDVAAIGDTAGTAKDVSIYGNNGAIYGNTLALLHMDEADGNTTFDESILKNNGTVYGNTRLLMHFEDVRGNVTYDETAYNNNATCYQTSSITNCNRTTGKSGNGMGFDGAQYLEIANSASINLSGALTLEAWAYPVAGDYRTILSKGYYTSDLNYALRMPRDSEGTRFTFNIRNATGVYGVGATTTNNAWYHVVGTYNLSHSCIYLNSQLANCSAVSGAILTNDLPLRIGRLSSGTNTEYFVGKIDEVAVYSVALNSTEILSHYNAGRAKYVDWVAGKSGTGLKFDGIDDYVSISNSTPSPADTITVEAWVNWNNVNDGEILYRSYSYFLYNGNSGSGLSFTVANSTTTGSASVSTAWQTGRWYHYVGTYDRSAGANNLKLYVDGVLAAQATHSGIINTPSSGILLGNFNAWSGSDPFNGSIDEVGIYNRSLSADEVLARYNAGRAKHADWDPAGRWGSAIKFDGVNDKVTTAATTSGINGGMTASAWVKEGTLSSSQKIVSKGSSFLLRTEPTGAIRTWLGTSEGWHNAGTSAGTFNWTDWHHVALTYNATTNTTKLYRDGACVFTDTTTSTGPMTETSYIYTIGGESGTSSYNGSIDEVRVWNRALSDAEIAQQYYISINKFAPSSWIFQADLSTFASGNYSYQLWAQTARNATLSSESRTAEYARRIGFFAPTLESGLKRFVGEVPLNATILNASLSEMKLDWNGTNYTFYDGSLMLNYGFDDVAEIGENGTKAVDTSRYGNNGTVYGDGTHALLHFDENESGTVSNYGGSANNGRIYGNTVGLWHLDEGKGPAAIDQSGYGRNGILYGSDTALLLHLDEGNGITAYDESAYLNNGSINGATWTTGKSGTGLQFDGTDDYVSFAASASLNMVNKVTVAAWVKRPFGATADAFVVSKSQRYSLRLQPTQMMFRIINSSGLDCDVNYANNLVDGNWHFIVGTYDKDAGANSQKLYVDGVLVDQRDTTGTIQIVSDALTLGRMSPTQAYWFNGTLDEVAIYNRTLTAGEVLAQYNAGRAKHLDWVEGKTGTGISFDGINDYVNISNQIKGNFSQISAEMWFRVNDIPYDNYLLAFGYDANYRRLDLKANSTGIYLARIQGIHNNLVYVASRPIVGQWHHVAYTFAKNSQARLYFDGQMVANATALNIDLDLNSPLGEVIGGRFNGAETLNGTIDEVGIYNRSLTASEVLEHFNAGRAKHLEKVEGKSGQGVAFDGSGKVLNLSANITLSSNTSVSAWFKTNVSGGPQSTQMPFATWFVFCYVTDKILCATDSSSTGNPVFGSNLNDDQWHHLVLSSNGTNSFGYVDGTLLASWAETLSTGSQGFYVGKFPRATGNIYSFNGNVDEVAVINRTLSPQEVGELYRAGRAHTSQWAEGEWGGAMRFDGIDDYVYSPVAGNVSAIEYWIYANTDAGAVMDLDGANRVMLNALLMGNNATTYINGEQVDLSQYATGSELVQNGGFEGAWTDLGDGYSLPPEWTRISTNAYPQEEITIVNTGNKSLRLGAACCAEKRISQTIPIVQGSYYLYTFYGYGPKFRTYVTNGFLAKDIDPPTQYQKYAIPFVASATDGNVIITNALNSLSNLRFDDASVRQVTSPVQKGVWTHVALVLDEPIATANITIGKVNSTFFNGSLDEVRVWNRSLSSAEVAQHYYGSLSKYAPDRWAFQSAVRNLSTGNYTYMLYANNSLVPINSFERRSTYASAIAFSSPTPANSSNSYESNITVNATLATPSLIDIGLDWNGTNYTFLNDSLVLAYNFDDAQPLDTAARAVDHSRYGNNGTILGNTIALWHFDENAGSTTYDESAYKNNGTVSGATWASGKSGSGLQFDGSNDYVTMGSTSTMGIADELSVFAWIKVPIGIPDGTRVGIIIGNYPGTPHVNLEAHTYGRLRVYWNGEIDTFSTGFDLRDGNWHFVGFTRKGSINRIQMYIDGAANTTAYAGSNLTLQWPLKVGDDFRSGSSPGIPFNGTIDEVMIANRTLTSSEVLALYNSGKAHHADWEADGKFGSAIKFDGKATYVRAPTSFTGENYTWSAWVKAASLSGTQHILGGRRGSSYWNIYGYGLALEGTELNGFLATNADPYFYDNLRVNFSSYANQWTHVALTWNNRSSCMGKLYVNGALAKAVSHCMKTTDIYNPGVPYGYTFAIGAYNCSASSGQGPGYFFSGSIDEVRAWNRTLTDAEITQQYYGSLNKYAPDKWVFVSNEQELESARQKYFVYARDADGTVGNSELRTLSTRTIIFRPPTPANGTTYPVGRDSTINATIQNVPVSQIYFGLNNTNYTFLNDSLLLALDFEDSADAGDTASKATDYSQYGNNGTIYGNTLALLHMDEGDGNRTFDESNFKNNATIYGNTRLLMHFEEGSGSTVYDETSWRSNGTCYSGVTNTCTRTAGRNGSGIDLDGADDYILVPNTAGINVTGSQLSMEMWFKPRNVTAGYSFLMKKQTPGYLMTLLSDGRLDIEIYHPDINYSSCLTSAKLASNNWYHVVGTFIENQSLKIYVNGALNATCTPRSLPMGFNNAGLSLGYTGWWGSNNAYFNGTIDEAAVYSKALNETEVADHYNARKAKFVEWAAGKSGTALQFDGFDDYASIPSTNLGTVYSIETWLWPGAYNNADWAAVLSNNYIPEFGINPARSIQLYSRVVGPTLQQYAWSHVVVTRDGSNHSIYVNGIMYNTTSVSATSDTFSIIGAYQPTAASILDREPWSGMIDELAMFNRSLTGAEVQQHFNAGRAKHADWDPNGRWGSAMKFDGVDDYVEISDSPRTRLTNGGTISAWIYPKDIGENNAGRIIHKGSDAPATDGFEIQLSTSNTLASNVVGASTFSSANAITYNQWNFVTLVFNSSGRKIYVNGVDETSTGGDNVALPPDVAGVVAIGNRAGATDRTFNGSIDEVRIWNRTLSASEIQLHYYSNLAKYGASKWLFTSNLTSASEGSYAYQLFASNGEYYSSQSRSFAVSATSENTIQFMPPTPANGATIYESNITINATLQSVAQVSQITFNWDGLNYTMYNDSLVLAYNFDDVASIGDTAGNATDVSSYGNTGRVYGNTLALLHMDENSGSTAYDEGTNKNNGTCVNSTGVKACTWSAGKSGTGIYINGSRSEYVNLSRSASVKGLSAASAELWYKAASIPTSEAGIYYESTNTTGYVRFGLSHFPNGSIRAGMRDNEMGNGFYCYSPIISLGTWHHLVMTFDAGSDIVALYIDGALNCSDSTTKGPLTNTASADSLALGGRILGGLQSSINGTVDEFVLHNRTLTASEVLSRYNMGAAKHSDWDPAGRWGSAIKFDGADDYINITQSQSLVPGNTLAVEAWIKPNTVAPAEQTILRKGSSYLLRLKGSNLSALAYTSGSWRPYKDVPNIISAGEWTHVAFTYNGTNFKYYKNGIDVTPEIIVMSGAINDTSAGSFVISQNGLVFNGSMDEVRIWNRSLSQAEIQQHYYSNVAKYGVNKWLFSSERPDLNSTTYTYYLWAANALNAITSGQRSATFNGIQFMPPTPANAAVIYNNNITLNASIRNLPALTQAGFNWDGINYTMYNDSLVLAYNFDDVASIGETAVKVVDASRYGNNGTIYGNTVLLLHMDENSSSVAYDEGVWRNNGTCYNMSGGSGVTNCNWVTGKSGTGIQFDGVDDYVVVPDSPSISLGGSITECAWAYWTNSSQATQHIVSKYRNNYYSTGTENGYGLRVGNAAGRIDWLADGNGTFHSLASGWNLPVNQWHHVCGVFVANTKMEVYVDGVLRNSTAISFGLADGTYDLLVGAARALSNSDFGRPFNGTIDEVLVANRSLSASEILAQYNSGKAKHADWDSDGKWGSAAKFDGVDDYVRSNLSLASYSTLTMSAWASIATYGPTDKTIVGQSDTTKNIQLEADADGGIRFRVRNNTGWYEPANVSMPTNQWFQLTGVYNGTHIITYVDGIARGSVGYASGFAGFDNTLEIGGWHFYSGNDIHFNGSVDEVRIWNRSLSQAEITQQYYSNIAKYAPDRWLFTSVQPDMNSTTYNYYAWASNASRTMVGEQRSATFNGILFAPPTPANASVVYASNITINATIQNTPAPTQVAFSWNGTNYTMYHDSLVLAYNFDDVASIGDTAAKVVDASRYGNNGTIYGNTLGLWRFDENTGSTAYDESIYRNNGTISGAAWASGKSGTALRFDGSNDYISVAHSASQNPVASYSFEIWFKANDTAADRGLFGKWSGAGSAYAYWAGINRGGTRPGCISFCIYNGSVNCFDIPGTNVSDGNWHHFIGTYSATDGYQRTYIDGQPNATTNRGTGLILNNSEALVIGKGYNTGYFFNGTIDEFGIYNRSLSADEALVRYNAGRARHADWDPAGRWGSAMKFDGVNNVVSGGNSSSVNIRGNLSLEAWIKPAMVNAIQRIGVLGKGNAAKRNYDFFINNGTIMLTMEGLWNPSISSTSTISVNNWYHIAGVYDNASLKIYINGELDAQTPSNGTQGISYSPLAIGCQGIDVCNSYSTPYNGSIDEVRIWNRTLSAAEIQQHYYSNLAKYAPDRWLFTSVQPGTDLSNGTTYAYSLYITNATGAFASEQRIANYSGAGSIDSDNYTKLLIHGEETMNGIYFNDSSPSPSKNLSAYGNAAESGITSRFGGKSWYFDGSGDYLTVPASNDWNFTTADFTVDFWANFDETLGSSYRTVMANPTGNNWEIYFQGGALKMYIDGTHYTGAALNPAPVQGTWYHFAIERSGDNLNFYQNGTLLGTFTGYADASAGSGISNYLIGNYAGVSYFNGYIDEFRISKGIARWTSNFTPPDRAYG